jgi:hypothetical protein
MIRTTFILATTTACGRRDADHRQHELAKRRTGRRRGPVHPEQRLWLQRRDHPGRHRADHHLDGGKGRARDRARRLDRSGAGSRPGRLEDGKIVGAPRSCRMARCRAGGSRNTSPTPIPTSRPSMMRWHPELFPDAEDPSKGAVFNGPQGWGGTVVTAQLYKAYGAEAAGFDLVDTGSAAGLDGSIAAPTSVSKAGSAITGRRLRCWANTRWSSWSMAPPWTWTNGRPAPRTPIAPIRSRTTGRWTPCRP